MYMPNVIDSMTSGLSLCSNIIYVIDKHINYYTSILTDTEIKMVKCALSGVKRRYSGKCSSKSFENTLI